MRSFGLLATRVVFGSYLAAHGAQKLFGSFEGHGLEATAKGFDSMGLRPGKVTATLAGASEFGGGILTAAGIADPLGPLAIAGTMAVAAAVHRKQGPFMQKGGFELPLTNFAIAIGLLSVGPGKIRLGPRLPKSLTRLSVLGGIALASISLYQLLSFEPEPAPAATASPVADEAPVASDHAETA